MQSDDAGFLAAAATFLPDPVFFTDENLSRGTGQGFQHALWLLSIVVIMSRCRYLVCTSSNVSIWMVLYRGHTSGVLQYLKQRQRLHRNARTQNPGDQVDYWICGDELISAQRQ